MNQPHSAYVGILSVLLTGGLISPAHAQFTGDSVRIVEDPDVGTIRVGTYKDILPKLQILDATHCQIAEAIGLSRSYVSDVLRGEKIPSLTHWSSILQIVE